MSYASDGINIAIDGPAGAGKSTVARKVASKLAYVYVDTGAMYRAITLNAQRNGISPDAHDELTTLVNKMDLKLVPSESGQQILLFDEDITDEIRSREVTSQVSLYAAHEQIRKVLSEIQRKLAMNKGIVMDGRDIGTHVLPDAELKIFLTASVTERALRRYQELTKENYISLDRLKVEIAERDKMDESRSISPLIQADDALLIDSSHMTIEEVVEMIVHLSHQKLAEAK